MKSKTWATMTFETYTVQCGTGSEKMCFHWRSLCSMPLSNAVSSVISSGIMNTAQIWNEFVPSVCHRSKLAGNFFVRQTTKNSSSATSNGRTKITRKASVRFSFSSSACKALNNDITQSSLRQPGRVSELERCLRVRPVRGQDERRRDDDRR